MRRITTVLKSSEALAVRRAVTRAGANNFVLFPVSPRAELNDWNCGSTEKDGLVRIEVTAEEDSSEGILSAIMKTAHVGKIEAFTIPMFSRKAA